MQRVFTKDWGPYKAGHIADWPLATWKTYFPDYDKITRTVGDVLTDLVVLDKTKDKRHGKA
jgi:hypothetical protein